MFAFAKNIGINAILCIGECEQEVYRPFDHSWLLIDNNVYDLIISMPFFNFDMAKGSVIASICTRTNKNVDIKYDITYIGLNEQDLVAYNNNIYDYLYGFQNTKFINAVIDLANNLQIYITRKWL